MAYFQKRNEEENNQNNNQNGGSFQTSSSEVGTNTGLMNDNSNRQNNISNQSGNWVNLNDYIKANEGKSGRYASTLVSDDLNKGDQHKTDVENQKTNFGNAVREDTAYKMNANKSNNIAKTYYTDSSKVSDNDLSDFAKSSKGYQGVGEFNTYDGYTPLKETSDYFSVLTGGILDPTYRANNKMNANLNQGGKILNNLTLNSTPAQDVLKNASNQFSLISGVLAEAEEEANKDRAGVVDIANQNAEAVKKAIAENKALAQKQLDDSKKKAEQARQILQNKAKQVKTYTPLKINLGSEEDIDLGSFKGSDTNEYLKDGSAQIQDSYTKERNEIKQRESDLLSGNRTSNSKLDLIQDTSSYDSVGAAMSSGKEETRAQHLPDLIMDVYNSIYSLNSDRGESSKVQKYVKDSIANVVQKDQTVRNAMQSYVLGNINEDTLKSIISNSIPRYKTAGLSDWITRAFTGWH